MEKSCGGGHGREKRGKEMRLKKRKFLNKIMAVGNETEAFVTIREIK